MAMIRHPGTGLAVGDGDRIPLRGCDHVALGRELDAAAGSMILSASGWRTVFSADGDEEGRSGGLRPVHEVVAAVAAGVFADFLKDRTGLASPTVLLGIDARPTGPALADVMARSFLAAGCKVAYCFIVAAPEIMAYARSAGAKSADEGGSAQGFAYISASHNPIGHNGFKFGLTDGGVLPADQASALIQEFRRRIADPACIGQAEEAMASVSSKDIARVFTDTTRIKREAHSAYLLFTLEVVTGAKEPRDQELLLETIGANLKERPLGVVADFNGSARTTALDRDLLSSLGVSVLAMNERPTAIAHRIVPEGSSLEPCRLALEAAHRENGAFVMGYVPDCDGDRGNLVIWDEALGSARSLEAQEVFALCCVAELAHMVWAGELRYDLKGNALDKVAVAVNDPTSMRVDRIAQAFDVSVFRAEVGEANVVGLARKLREQGYRVRILGEGAAGGNITHPSAVRDPIDTVFALLKLLSVRSENGKTGLFELWCDLSDQAEAYRSDFTLADVIATLPSFVSTSAYAEDAVLRIATADHAALKGRYQEIFLREWETRKKELKTKYGIASWEPIAYKGMDERRGIKDFSEAGKGGLKVLFKDEGGHETAYIWMRGSGTEPVFRIMADAAGNDRRIERDLLAWQSRMVLEADRA